MSMNLTDQQRDNENSRIEKIEKRTKYLQAYALFSTLFIVIVFASGASFQKTFETDTDQNKEDDNRVLRARGLVIVDKNGKDRILIGAPIPDSADRVRTDLKRVKEIYGSRFPKEFMDYYKKYDHSANGMIILDENGFDKIAIGDPVPDLSFGKRIAPATGMILNDEQGIERSGYALLKVNDVQRVTLGMDGRDGKEGLLFILDDNGVTGVNVRGAGKSIFLGNVPDNKKSNFGFPTPFHGLQLKSGKTSKDFKSAVK